MWPERKLEGGDEKIAHKKIWWRMLLVRSSYTDAFTHRRSQKLLRTEAFTHTGAFTQRSLYTERLLDTEDFTHRGFYTEKSLYRLAFTRRSFYTERSLYTENFNTQKLLHREDANTVQITHEGWIVNVLVLGVAGRSSRSKIFQNYSK